MIQHRPFPDTRIKEHECAMLSKIQNAISAYDHDFAKYGCTVECGLMWSIFPSDRPLLSRIPSCRGYCSYVYCAVTRNGIQVNIPSFDGEVDYNSLSCSWQVVSISASPFNPEISFISSIEDIPTDIEDILDTLRTHHGY